MAKGQTQSSTNMANANTATNTAQGTQTQGALWGQLPGAQQTSQGNQTSASNAYKDYSGGTGSYDPDQYGAQYNQNNKNIATGGYNPETLKQVQTQQQSNIASGGYDPAKMSQIQSEYNDMTSKGMGGIDTTSAQTIRDSYGNLIKTGGLSDETADAMRRQAASSAQSVYSTMGQNLARQNTAQGVTAGGDTAQLARQAAESASTATTGANAQIGQIRQQGTIAGTGGLSSFEQGATGLQQSAVKGQADVAGSEASNRLAATGQAAATASDQAHGTLTASQAQQDLATNAANQRIQAAGGLANLYATNQQYVVSLVNQIMQSQNQTGQLNTEQAQIMAELSKNPGLFQTILGDVTALAGAAGGVMTGVGGMNRAGSTGGGH